MKCSCLLCRSGNTSLLYQNPPDYDGGIQHHYDLYICRECGAIIIYPMPKSLDEIAGLYPQGYYTVSENKSKKQIISFLEQAYIEKELRYLQKICGDTGRLLDAGCGSGKYLLMLRKANKSFELYGNDIKIPEELLNNTEITFIASDFLALPFENNYFDVIRMGNVIEHVTNPGKVFEKAYALLKKGGVLIGETPDSRSLGHRVWKSFWGPLHTPRHLVIFDKHNLTKLLKEKGFTDIEILPTVRPSGWAKSIKNILVQMKVIKPIDHRSRLYPLLLLFTFPFFLGEYFLRSSSIMVFLARK